LKIEIANITELLFAVRGGGDIPVIPYVVVETSFV
jgi:hypothetical protein